MTAGRGNIVTGFIEGLVIPTGASPTVLPFANKIGEATFRYNSSNLMVETFSTQGIKGASASCPFREECSIELTSQNLAWSFVQAATNTLAQNNTLPLPTSISLVLSTFVAGNSTAVLTDVTASTILPVYAADEDGVQYPITVAVADGDTTFTFTGLHTGKKVTIFYHVAASGTNNLIRLGSGTKLGEIGVYGRFFGCPSNYQVVIPRGIIEANLELSVGENPGTASLTVKALQDNNGDYAYMIRI